MPWKMDEQGNIAVNDGNPVWVGDDGSEVAVNHKDSIVKIATANREAAEHRKGLKEAQDKLKAFEAIEDPKAALEAIQFKASMEGKKVWDEESTKRAIDAALKPLQDENATLKEAVNTKDSTIYKMKVSDRFNTSTFLKDKTVYGETPEVAEAFFGKHFTVDESGKLVANDHQGNPIYSSAKAGELADFDEALSILIGSHPRKDHMLKGSGANGSGSQGSGGSGGQGGAKQVSREVFNSYTPFQQMDFSKNGGTITD